MNNEIKVMNNDEIRDFCIKKDLKIFELEQELQQKENIIKKVREYIEEVYKRNEEGTDNIWILDFYKISEILDKESNEKI